jgi:hypothetical protein
MLDRQDEVRASPVQVVRRGTLAMQGISRYDSPVQAQLIERGVITGISHRPYA